MPEFARPVRTMTLEELEDERLDLIAEECDRANEIDDVGRQIEVSRIGGPSADPEWLRRATTAFHCKRNRLRSLRTRLRLVESRMGQARRERNLDEDRENQADLLRCFVSAAKAMLPEATYLGVWKLARSLARQRGGEGRSIAC